MQIHLVFEPELLSPLKLVIEEQGHQIIGTDQTLEQFRDFVSSGESAADIAIIDGTLGVAKIQECMKVMREIRSTVPDLRLIVILPEDAEKRWIQALSRIGIYDIHCVSSFSKKDVVNWLDKKKTIADAVDNEKPIEGKIVKNILKMSRSPTTTVTTVERIVGCVAIGIAGVDRRCGSTHLALSIAVYLASRFRVALIELASSCLKTMTEQESLENTFKLKGVDVYSDVSVNEIARVLSAGYDYIVIDFGGDLESVQGEYMRCHERFVLAGSSEWDLVRLYGKLDGFMEKYPSSHWNIAINFSDTERFEQISGSLSSKQKQELKLRMLKVPFHANPLQPPSYETWLQDVLPQERKKNRFLRRIKVRMQEVLR